MKEMICILKAVFQQAPCRHGESQALRVFNAQHLNIGALSKMPRVGPC